MRSDLTPLELLAQGSTNKQIGTALEMSENTARHHVNNIMQELQAPDRAKAVATAMRSGVLSGAD